MSDTAQNDWEVVGKALPLNDYGRPQEAHHALARLREFTEVTIAGLNERISELEAELDERNEVVVAKEPWPRPANLPPTW